MDSLSIWNILFIIGLITQTTKLAEIIMRPHQQRWVQDKFDTFALYLDDIHPIAWFRHIVTRRSIRIITLLISADFIWNLALKPASILLPNWSFLEIKSIGVFLMRISPMVIAVILAMNRPGIIISSWLYNEGKFGVFIKRFLIFIIGGGWILGCMLFATILWLNFQIKLFNKFILPNWLIIVQGVLYWAFFNMWMIFALVAGLVIFLQGTLLL